jgi:pyruvate dehydrogenase E2 component (dihydrolipoamide acetyltransferase)
MNMPELAESVVEGEILKWLVSEGDQVKLDQPVVEVMTDKVTVELPSPFAGTLERKLAREGDVVAVHAPIAVFADETGGSSAETPSVTVSSANKASQTVSLSTPSQERSIIESGATVEDDAAEAQSLFKAFDRSETIKMPVRKGVGSKVAPSDAVQAQAGTNEFGRVLAVPAARAIARENGVQIADVPGSGPNGRVRVNDVLAFLENPQPATPPVPEKPSPSTENEREARRGSGLPVPPVQYKSPKGFESLEERVPLRGLRRAISNQMLASHLYTVRTLTVDEADMTALVKLRERIKPTLEAQGVKLSYLPFILKAIASGLKVFPSLNASLDEAAQEIVLKRYYNLGMAVATDAGLIVPVLREVDRKSILELAREITDVGTRARDGKLKPEEMTGSTFSVTNIGSIGALFSFPIINVPDAAIMGIHSIQKRAVVIEHNGEDQIVVRQMMYLSLSFDHRLVDGAEAARFCKHVIRLLENPDALLLEV